MLYDHFASVNKCFISDKNWLAEGVSFIPVDPTGALELEPMTTKCQIGGKGYNQEISHPKTAASKAKLCHMHSNPDTLYMLRVPNIFYYGPQMK